MLELSVIKALITSFLLKQEIIVCFIVIVLALVRENRSLFKRDGES